MAETENNTATVAATENPPVVEKKEVPPPAADSEKPEDKATADEGKTDEPAAAEKPTDEAEKKDNTDAGTEKKGESAPDVDESWYGPAPSEESVKTIKTDLGDEVADLYVRAYKQYRGAEKDGNAQRLIIASGTFVEALGKVSENNQMTMAFGQISLAYGKSLVRYIEIEGSGSTAVTSKIVKAIQSAVQGGRAEAPDDDEEEAGAAAEGADEIKKDSDADKKEQKDKEEEKDDDEENENDAEDMENLETAWTHLELARVVFSKHNRSDQEAECRYTLGELLMACDEGKQAGSEFATAVQLFDDKRRKAECCYKQYLAVRNTDRAQAAQALKQGVEILETVENTEEELKEMKTELKDFEDAMQEEDKAKVSTTPTEVQVVRPKRKRDVQKEANGNGAPARANGDSADTPSTPAAEKKDEATANGNGSAASPAEREVKKQRVEEAKA